MSTEPERKIDNGIAGPVCDGYQNLLLKELRERELIALGLSKKADEYVVEDGNTSTISVESVLNENDPAVQALEILPDEELQSLAASRGIVVDQRWQRTTLLRKILEK